MKARFFRALAFAFAMAAMLFAAAPEASAQAFDGDDDFKAFAGYLNAGGMSGVVVGIDKGANDWLSIGFAASYIGKDKRDRNNEARLRWDMMLTGNYHWQEVLNLPMPFDIYTGIHAGIRSVGVQGGARYNFSETFGIYVEARQNIFDVVKSSGDVDCYYYRKFCFGAGLTVNF